jgi:hypothetical protein
LARLKEDPLPYWARGEEDAPDTTGEPLAHATALEDLGSSTARFPLAHAVFASAAFPGAFQPMILAKYRQATPPATSAEPAKRAWWQRDGVVTIVDGGIYDNTGISTALELFHYLQKADSHPPAGAGAPLPRRRLVLLSIDANNEPDTYAGPTPGYNKPFRLDAPLRGLIPAVSTVMKLYTKQQSLVHAALHSRLETLRGAGLVDYFELDLATATPRHPALKAIPTDFVLTDREDTLLEQVAGELLNQPTNAEGKESLATALIRKLRGLHSPEVAPGSHDRPERK